MIVRRTDEGWRCVTQGDHARLSRDILALWRRDGLPEHPRRDQLLLAVREHDNGWRETDAAPRRDSSGPAPRDFLSLSDRERREVWRRGIRRHFEERPYAAALILEHALYLHRDRRPDPAWEAFFTELDDWRELLLVAARLEDDELRRDYRWLHLADLLSLALCAGWSDPFERWGYVGRARESTLEISPFPLAGATRFEVPCRTLRPGRWESDAALATALAASRWQRWTVRLAPP